MSSKDKTIEVLKSAKTLVTQGWTREALARTEAGVPANVDSIDATHFCLVGAVHQATANKVTISTMSDYVDVRRFALRELRNALKAFPGHDTLMTFNDSPKTAQDDVLKLFDIAISELEKS